MKERFIALAENRLYHRSTLLVAKGVLHYLLDTKHWKLIYGGSMQNDSIAFCDVDWMTNEHDRRSISGYAFFMYSGLVL